jgi:dTDP-4-dehydrorhamnose reductase
VRRLIVLGANGMLGSEVSRVAMSEGIHLEAISRSSEISFDAETSSFADLAKELKLTENDWLVNCIGWIPQKSSGNLDQDQRLATLLNTTLPGQICESKAQLGFNWIQIATDCVFRGDRGGYLESDTKDADDIYGLSKIAGEKDSAGAIQIRSSIIGRDTRTNSGMYSWFKSAVAKGSVDGYVNQIWNGVSTTAFARLAVGMLRDGWKESLSQHWLPSDAMSKYELLELFANYWGYSSSLVAPVDSEWSLDRTLGTQNAHTSETLWALAGYAMPPSIAELCGEFIEIDRKLGLANE